MLTIISPAKKLDYEKTITTSSFSQPDFLEESSTLMNQLKMLKAEDLEKLMKLSPKLADLNVERNKEWSLPFNTNNARQALFAFNGEVYTGLDAYSLNEDELQKAQKELRILSGLYGLLKPLDLMQPYRLEMGTKFATSENCKNLYEFWGDKLTNAINELLEEEKVLINLASTEYFKSVKPKQLIGDLITPTFKDEKNGSYKVIMMYAKKARGSMTRYLLQNDITNTDELKVAEIDGYIYNEELSKGNDWVFTRG
ncbi:MAG: peroxide stress protein YaaA [Cytophagales bacterium]|nr:peroxide stress protein YaaA [Cytophagales bacterium]